MTCAARTRERPGLRVIGPLSERRIDAPQHIGGVLVDCPDHDAVWMQKVDNRSAFAQKLRIGNHVEALRMDAMAVQHAADPLVGVDRHSALFYDYLVAPDGTCNLGDHGLDIRQICGASITLGGADGYENSLARFHCGTQIGGKLQPTIPMFGQQLGQMVFEYGHAALTEGIHPGFVVINADNAMPHFGEAGRRDKSDISGPYYTNGNLIRHRLLSLSRLSPGTWLDDHL